MKAKKIIALVLVGTMLMGQTAWAQEGTDGTQVQENQEVQENIAPDDTKQTDMEQTEEMQEENEGINNSESEVSLAEKDAVVTEEEEISESADDLGEEEEKIAEKSVDSENEEDIETEIKTICVDYPIMVETHYDLWGDSSYEVVSADDSICTVEGYTYEQNEIENIYIVLTGKKEGETTIDLKIDDNIVKRYDVTVNPLPDDAVIFPDIALRTKMCDDWYSDANNDGCISKSELANIEVLNLSGDTYGMYNAIPVQDLSGLENATNLAYLYLDGNSKLSNIDVLFEMNSLKKVDLTGTNVSSEDRWKLADFHDMNLSKGDSITLPSLRNIFEEGLVVEITEGEDSVDLSTSGTAYSVIAKSEGEVKISISYKDLSTEIAILIDGIPAEQEVGKDFDVEVEGISNPVANSTYADKSLMLDSNHQLWQIYPTGEKLKSNVKAYVAEWVYYGENYNDAEQVAYLLDTDNVLWNGMEKLAEDVVKYDGRYALNSQGILTNFYNSGSEQIEQVEDWKSPNAGSEGKVYLLKTDGTLWTRQEVAVDQELKEWKKIDENVKQVTSYGYLKEDGTIFYYSGTESDMYGADIAVGEIISGYSFYDTDGNFCYVDESYCYDWNLGEVIVSTNIINMGKLDVEDSAMTDDIIYVLTKDHKVYKRGVEEDENALIMNNIIQWNRNGMYSYRDDERNWSFLSSDGTYYDLMGNPMTEILLKDLFTEPSYQLFWHADGTQIVEKNGIPILDCVVNIWCNYEKDVQYFALRTDGSVWNITKIPEKVLDLNQPSYALGDANGDNTVDLKDLMLCLNHVSKKSTLTDDAFVAADIDGNGTVELKDLMRILNYVSKKTEEL